MRRKQALTQTQQRAVERLAKGQGCTCIECGSADYLQSDTNVIQSFSNMMVALYCNNPDAEHTEGVLALGQSFPLSFAQAEAIGLKAPRPRRSCRRWWPYRSGVCGISCKRTSENTRSSTHLGE